jgi:hypothetical protein
MQILLRQPMIGGALVMVAVDQPAFFEPKAALEPSQRIGRRHEAAGEEVLPHPVVGAIGFERIEQRAVAEDVDEQLSVGAQPSANAG